MVTFLMFYSIFPSFFFQCIVQSYLQWLQDSDYDPTCRLCGKNLGDESCGACVRLSCYGKDRDITHWSLKKLRKVAVILILFSIAVLWFTSRALLLKITWSVFWRIYFLITFHDWHFNIGSGTGMILTSSKPLPKPIVTRILDATSSHKASKRYLRLLLLT